MIGETEKHTSSLVVVDVDALQLQVGVTMVGASWVDTMLVRYHLPELHKKCKVHCTDKQIYETESFTIKFYI